MGGGREGRISEFVLRFDRVRDFRSGQHQSKSLRRERVMEDIVEGGARRE